MLALLLLLGSATAEFSVQMPYPHPAGVTYTSHLAAYGPLAYKGYAGAPLAAPFQGARLSAAPIAGPYAAAGHIATQYAAAPIATQYASGPIATHYAAAPFQVARYAPLAAAPVVAAPASAVVPVTRVSAQPAVVQNIVDVARPNLATRRYQIRRPAIQKQFYDIEERIVVRPAGSAVVELEQPISTNQRGPTEIRPAVPVSQPLVRYAGRHNVHVASPVLAPAYLPAGPAVHEPSAEYEEFIHQQELVSRPPQQEYQPQPLPSQQEYQPQPLPPQPEYQPQPLPAQPEYPPQTLPPQPEYPSQSFQPQPFPPQGFQQQQQQQQQPQLDSADSVAIDNPELARARDSQNAGPIFYRPRFRPQQIVRNQQAPQFGTSEQRLFPSQLLERPRFPPSELLEGGQSEENPRAFSRAKIEELGSVAVPSVQPELPRPRGPLRPEISPRQGPTGPTPLAEIPSNRHLISPEQTDFNQRRLIELLTARGPVSELSSPDQPIRVRVLSATPAPPNALPADSQTNTRRVVVNRPIQTVQEVEVVQPFTKVDRVAVNQPALVKTAHVELAHVPAVAHVTAVPALHAAVTPVPYLPHYG